jgi:hypothetical protein
MADFSLTTLFVVPVGNTLPSSGSTQDLTAGQFGIFRSDYTVANAGNIAAKPYFYLAQGRTNTYLLASKRSAKISSTGTNVVEWYKVDGCGTPAVQITDVSDFSVKCGDVLTLTLRAHSSYLDTLYFNGFTRSVTIQAPCCDCGADPCVDTDVPTLIDSLVAKLNQGAPGINADNITLSDFFTFERIGSDSTAKLRIAGKALTAYGQPCDVAAFPHEYDRMWFRTFVYSGPATTADFIVSDACNIVATSAVVQRASYAKGTSAEIKQLEKNFYSYQAGYLKHLYRMGGYNENFESWVTDGTTYDTFYIKFVDYDKGAYQWGDYVQEDQSVIIACPTSTTAGIEAVLEAALGAVAADNTCITTTTTTSTTSTTTTSTTTLIP